MGPLKQRYTLFEALKSEREVSKKRADAFFGLDRGEFIAFADGKDKKVRFDKPQIKRALPPPTYRHDDAEITANFQRIHLEVRQLFSEP